MRLLAKSLFATQPHLKTNCIREALQGITQHDLLITDIDDTLVTTLGISNTTIQPKSCGLGSEQWFKSDFAYRRQFTDKHTAYKQTNRLFNQYQQQAILAPVEDNTIEQYNSIHANGTTIIGLTARHPSIASRTLGQLKEHKMTFTQAHSQLSFNPLPLNKSAIMINNIIFCDHQSKALTLLNFFDTPLGKQIKKEKMRIWFIDDLKKNIEALLTHKLSMPLPLITRHYTHVENVYTVNFTLPENQNRTLKPS